MGRRTIKQIALTTVLIPCLCAAVFAQQIQSPNESPKVVLPYGDEPSTADIGSIVFSNLDSDGSYNTDTFAAKPVAGRQAGGDQTERWDAVWFIPKVDVQVTTLSAAIGYISGTKLVNLALYDNDDILHIPRNPLPGGAGSTRNIPNLGQCCQMASVRLAGAGVALQAGVRYWLVASPDNINGPTFSGAWHVSNSGSFAAAGPPSPWYAGSGGWPAAEIRGTVQGLGPGKPADLDNLSPTRGDTAANRTIFTNLDPIFGNLYTAGFGALVTGNNVPFEPEVWEALPFKPKAAVHAKTLAAAIAHVSGTKEVLLGVYTDNGGIPGTLLPGGQGSTTNIPESGECCELATVRLPGTGVALEGGVQYWLVASTDDVNAADFHGTWQDTTVALGAYNGDFSNGWTDFSGLWFGAEIRGTIP